MEEILKRVKEDNIIFINFQFTDIHGQLKEMTAPVNRLEDILKSGLWFDGSSIEGFARIHESDLFLKPDLSTYSIIPWLTTPEGNTARFICDIYTPDGKPFPGDPRYVLKKTIQKAEEKGFIYKVGPEVEFYLFASNKDFERVPVDKKGYFDLATEDIHLISQDINTYLKTFGIEVEAIHHEVGPGQYEVDFRYSDALTTSDRLITLRATIKAIAQKRNLHVTFMPKPVMGIPGSGMHVHQSLFAIDGKRNLFFDSNNPYGLSELAYNFMAGQLFHIKSIMPVLCSTVNSYKRLIAGFEAPVYISWARINRSALIRVPKWFQDKPNSARIELRCPDPACNPYLAFAVMLATGLDGIEKKIPLPEPVEEDLYQFDEAMLRKRNIDTLPASLFEALMEMKKSQLVREVLGDHLYERYIAIKTEEWHEFRQQVTRWEIERYFDI